MALCASRRSVVLSFAAIAALALAGCGHRTPPPPKPVLTRIQVLPVTSPDRLYTYNNWVAGLLWASIANRVKTNLFDEKMEAERKAMGPKMTAALVEALREQGYEAEVIAVPSGYKDADYVDVTRLPTRDPVLYAQFGETGMDSGRLSSYYLPRVNIGATLSAPASGDALFSTSLYYGADASGNAAWSIEAEPRFRFPNFDALMERTPEVIESYDTGMRLMARRVAQQLKKDY